ncbi:MAG TPA: FecR family protein, partial [Hanamia sp.]|nr:FecR family protein [Hanamia sp.]
PSSRLEYLFDNYIHFKCTAEEEEELMALLAQSENEAAVHALIDETIKKTGVEMQMPDQVAASILQNILQKEKGLVVPFKSKEVNLRMWMRVAAAAVVFFAIASYWLFDKKGNEKTKIIAVAKKQAPILPGGNHAVLTMSDGSIMVLDSMQNGTLQHGSAKINKQGGVLTYNALTSSKSNKKVLYNTLSTPRGGQYEVVLPDGSKVWLNAESSLHFPTAFTGNQREVSLTGEAYFEVAKNKEKPFRVKVDGMSINVLGTHFNVNAYSDENNIKTSLLEGSVKIIKDNKSKLLKPGKQAIVNKKQDKIDISDIDMNGVMAWKNGLFQFEGASITTIMKEIGRWYNVEIVYSGNVPTRIFEGKISRSAELSEVLRILELSKVQFSVVGRKIIVQ